MGRQRGQDSPNPLLFVTFPINGQIWALQDGTTVVVGGKTNRAKGEFPDDMNYLLDQVPELVDSSASKQSERT